MDVTIKYIQGEERDGFYVQPLVKRVWAVELDILKVIDTICKRHNIKYLGWYGTLLGAIRHHGFIPWDDDMDLAMLREDYERFQYYCQTELPDGWKVFKVSPTLIRILNTDVISMNQEFLNKSHGCPLVVGVDVFALEHIPVNKEEEELWINLFWAAINLYEHWDMFEKIDQLEESKWEQLRELENLTGYYFDTQYPIKDQLYTLTDRIAAMYWDAESDEVAIMSTLSRNRSYRIPISCFDNIIEVPFEHMTIPILANYDLPCKLSYGNNYMTPVRCYEHSYIKSQINDLRDYFKKQGKELPEFFNME